MAQRFPQIWNPESYGLIYQIAMIWVWVKSFVVPNNWMVNTKPDIHICGPHWSP